MKNGQSPFLQGRPWFDAAPSSNHGPWSLHNNWPERAYVIVVVWKGASVVCAHTPVQLLFPRMHQTIIKTLVNFRLSHVTSNLTEDAVKKLKLHNWPLYQNNYMKTVDFYQKWFVVSIFSRIWRLSLSTWLKRFMYSYVSSSVVRTRCIHSKPQIQYVIIANYCISSLN